MFNWGRKKEPEAIAIEQSDEARLKEKFKIAVYGGFCRTQTYSHKATDGLGMQEWLEATTLGGERWSIFRMELAPGFNGTDEKGVVKREIYNRCKGLDFFGAMENLAKYESTQAGLDFELVSDDESDKLGYDYFRSFAEREGLVFDALGEPHPTVNGEVAGEGRFLPDSFEKAKKAHEEKQTFLHMPLNKKLESMSLKEFRKIKGDIEVIESVTVHLKRLLDAKRYDDEPWFMLHSLKGKKLNAIKDEVVSKRDSALLLLANTDRMFGGEETSMPLRAAVYFFKHLFLVDLAAFTQKHVSGPGCSHSEASSCTQETVDAFLKAAEKALTDVGYGDVAEMVTYTAFQNALRYNEKGDKVASKREMKKIVDQLEDMQCYYKQQLGIETGSKVKELPKLEYKPGA